MDIAILQMPVITGDKKQNLATLETMLQQAMDTPQPPEVILLPELWSTGFYPRPTIDYAEPWQGPTHTRLSQLARQHHVHLVAGSIMLQQGQRIFNTCLVLDPLGHTIASYQKIHLFSPAGENKDFTPGQELCIFELAGHTCGVIICYDLRFPELSRKLALANVELLFVPAAWPTARIQHWDILLQARAIENQCYIAGCNGLCPSAESSHYSGGHSTLLGPDGSKLIREAHLDSEPHLLTGSIDFGLRTEIRQKINVFRDRRPELYEIL